MTIPNEDPIITLYRESFPHFARMIQRMGGDLEQAKDAFHDALLIYLEKEKAGKLNIQSSPKAYVTGTAKICWLRSHRGDTPLPQDFDASEAEEPNPEEQERTLLELIGEGLTNRQIAERMFLAEKTIKNYVSRMLAKLGMERRTQAAVLATELRNRGHHEL